jgi:hypothetical protein
VFECLKRFLTMAFIVFATMGLVVLNPTLVNYLLGSGLLTSAVLFNRK